MGELDVQRRMREQEQRGEGEHGGGEGVVSTDKMDSEA